MVFLHEDRGKDMWFTKKQISKCERAHLSGNRTAIPSRIVSNGEYMPVLQTSAQKEVERRVITMADVNSKRLGISRRDYLRSVCGTAVSLLAMNSVFGKFFDVDEIEALEPVAAELASVPRGTFIFDDQLHHISDAWSDPIVLVLRTTAAGYGPPFGLNQQMIPWNPALVGTQIDFASVSFNNFVKEVFLDSVTTMGLIGGAASNPGEPAVLSPDGMANTRDRVNELFGSERLLSQGTIFPSIGTITPPAPGELPNLEEMERQVEENKIVSWKGYPIGDFVAALKQDFGVSKSVACAQIYNSPVFPRLDRQDQLFLESRLQHVDAIGSRHAIKVQSAGDIM